MRFEAVVAAVFGTMLATLQRENFQPGVSSGSIRTAHSETS